MVFLVFAVSFLAKNITAFSGFCEFDGWVHIDRVN